jgi:hypothetical protein
VPGVRLFLDIAQEAFDKALLALVVGQRFAKDLLSEVNRQVAQLGLQLTDRLPSLGLNLGLATGDDLRDPRLGLCRRSLDDLPPLLFGLGAQLRGLVAGVGYRRLVGGLRLREELLGLLAVAYQLPRHFLPRVHRLLHWWDDVPPQHPEDNDERHQFDDEGHVGNQEVAAAGGGKSV